MPPTPPTDAELDVMIRARLASLGIDLDQLPAGTGRRPADRRPRPGRRTGVVAFVRPGNRRDARRLPASRTCRHRRGHRGGVVPAARADALPLDQHRMAEVMANEPADRARRPSRVPRPLRRAGRRLGGRRRRRAARRGLGGRQRPPRPPTRDRPAGCDADAGQPNAYVRPRPEAVADPTELTLAEAAWLIRAASSPRKNWWRRTSPASHATTATYQAFNLVLADAGDQGGPRDAAERSAPRAAARHPAGHQGQLLHRRACRPPRTPTCSRTSCHLTTRQRWPG